MKRTLLSTLLVAGALVSAQSFAATTYFGDENDNSWVPGKAATARKDTTASTGASTSATSSTDLPGFHNGVRWGDENDNAWLPGAKR